MAFLRPVRASCFDPAAKVPVHARGYPKPSWQCATTKHSCTAQVQLAQCKCKYAHDTHTCTHTHCIHPPTHPQQLCARMHTPMPYTHCTHSLVCITHRGMARPFRLSQHPISTMQRASPSAKCAGASCIRGSVPSGPTLSGDTRDNLRRSYKRTKGSPQARASKLGWAWQVGGGSGACMWQWDLLMGR